MFRLGLIVPSSNTTMEPEFYALLPKNFTVHTARLKLREVTMKGLTEMEKRMEEGASKLADADVDIIGFGCTSGSLFRGIGHDKLIEEKIEKTSGKPAVATAGAVVDALKALEIRKVAVATPYINEINEMERNFLTANGFNVIDLKGLGLSGNLKIGRVDSQTVCKLVTGLKHRDADGIFISCTNLPSINVIEKLEEELVKPVISSNTATLWAMLKKRKVSAKILGYGKLFEEIYPWSP